MSGRESWWVVATDGCPVSPFLGVRQAFIAGRSTDGVALAQAGSLQLDPVRAMHDAVQNGIADRRVAEDSVMPFRWTGESIIFPCSMA